MKKLAIVGLLAILLSCIPFGVAIADESGPVEMQWNTFFGTAGWDAGNCIAVDGEGNTYIIGDSDGTWGSPVNAHSGGSDAVVVKLNSAGILEWNTFLGSSDRDNGNSIVIDSTGNIYIAGMSYVGWGSPINPYTGGSDAFVVKLDNDGALQWHTFMGSTSTDYGVAITLDSDENVCVDGVGNASWGSPVRAFSGGWDTFVFKLDHNGVLLWNTFIGSPGVDGGQSLQAITADNAGNLFLTGASNASWGSPLNPYTGGVDAFVAMLDTDGVLQWNTFMGSAIANDSGHSMTVDGNGDLYVVGTSNDSWGTPVNPYAGGIDTFIARLDRNGALTWNTFIGSSGFDSGYTIAADTSGNVYTAGISDQSWGSPVVPYAGGSDAYIASLDNSGILQWNTFMGTTGWDTAGSVAVDEGSGLYVTGISDAAWGDPVDDYIGGYDAFVARIVPVTPDRMIQSLILDIQAELDLPYGTENGLIAKLDVVINSLEKDKEATAINQLEAFINYIEAQRGNKLTDSEADMLIEQASAIIGIIESS